MTPRTVWLASYPKSGNTWVRAIVAALDEQRGPFGLDRLVSGAQPDDVADAIGRLGLDPRWLSRADIDRLRAALISSADQDGDTVFLRKTHERYRRGDAEAEPFPASATRAAILVVRDPRDVVCSFAPFFGVDLDTAIEAMAGSGYGADASPMQSRTAQPWGTWSEHGAAWLDPSVPFPVHPVRYEDLCADAVSTLGPALRAVGFHCSDERLAAAVEAADFDRLRASEETGDFREMRPKEDRFFRRGRAGGWRDELSDRQVTAVEADHADMMQRLGYELTTTVDERRAVVEKRASRRRQSRRPWTTLPDWLDLDVTEGPVPDHLDGAEHPRPWLQSTPTATRVQFSPTNVLLVADGRRATLQWDTSSEADDADLGWLVEGWTVALAWLQRGNIMLHASTVRIGSEVVAIAGQSGAGKSTTTMALRRRGHELIVDDTTLIAFGDDGARVMPYHRNVHLLPDAAAALGVEFDDLPPLAGSSGKAGFLPEAPASGPCRIDRVVVLGESPTVTSVQVDEVEGIHRVSALAPHAVQRGLAPILLGRPGYFTRITRLANAVRVQELSRPADRWSLEEVLDAIEAGAHTIGV